MPIEMSATNQEGSVLRPVSLKRSSNEVAIIKLSSVIGDSAVPLNIARPGAVKPKTTYLPFREVKSKSPTPIID